MYWGTYKQIHLKINLPVYLHASLSSYHKDLPVTTTTCVHVHRCTRSGPYEFIFILSFRLTIKIYSSSVVLFYMSTYVPFHQYTSSVYFLFFCTSYAMTFQIIYWGTYPQVHSKVNVPVYPHDHRCTRLWPCVFIFRLSFQLTVQIYLFTVLLFYMSKDVPVHQYTCSVCFFFFGITCATTFQLICCGTYPQIHPKIYLPVYIHAFLTSNHKDLPVTTTTCVHAHRYTRSWPYLFMFILSFRLTV